MTTPRNCTLPVLTSVLLNVIMEAAEQQQIVMGTDSTVHQYQQPHNMLRNAHHTDMPLFCFTCGGGFKLGSLLYEASEIGNGARRCIPLPLLL